MNIDKNKIYEVGEFSFKNYIHLTEEEKRMVLDWRNDDSVRFKMYNSDVIPLENHLAFIDSLNKREDCYYWLVYKQDNPFGTVNIIHVDNTTSSCESGYLVDPELAGNGDGFEFAKARLQLWEQIGVKSLFGSIRIDNVQAIILTEYLGAKQIGSKYIEIQGERVLFLEYKNDLTETFKNSFNELNVKGLVRYYKNRIKELS